MEVRHLALSRYSEAVQLCLRVGPQLLDPQVVASDPPPQGSLEEGVGAALRLRGGGGAVT